MKTIIILLYCSVSLFGQWEYIQSPTSMTLSKIYFLSDSIGYIVGDNSTILKTTDGGVSWELKFINTSTQDFITDICFVNNDKGYAVSIMGLIYITNDGGETWMFNYIGYQADFRCVYFTNELTGFIGGSKYDPVNLENDPILLKTTDGGINWYTEWTNYYFAGVLNSICFMGNTGIVAVTVISENSLILKTTNGGITWQQIDFGLHNPLNSIFLINENTIFACGVDIFKSTDGGNSWMQQTTDIWDLSSLFFVSENTGFAVGYGNILKTTDGGLNWEMNFNPPYWMRSVVFLNENIGYAVGQGGVMLKTTTGGVVPVEFTSFTANYLISNVNLIWTTATELNNNGFEIERSTDKTDWRTIGFKKGEGTTTEPQQYSYSDDLSDITSSKLYYRLKQIDFNGSFEYSDIVEVDIAPTTFFLEQNYPNPFNPSTKISWQSPVGSWQTLKVYDVLGNEVATLVNEYKAAGSYQIEFNPESSIKNLASGIYFYRLNAGDYVETKKMILMK